MRVSGNTGSMKYEEMEVDEDKLTASKGIVFVAEKESDQLQDLKDSMVLMANCFGKALKRVLKGAKSMNVGLWHAVNS